MANPLIFMRKAFWASTPHVSEEGFGALKLTCHQEVDVHEIDPENGAERAFGQVPAIDIHACLYAFIHLHEGFHAAEVSRTEQERAQDIAHGHRSRCRHP